MIANEQQVRIAAVLYQHRDAARSLLGDKYHERMASIGCVISGVAAAKGVNTIQAAMLIAKQLSGFEIVQVMAAAVELTEPTPQGAAA